MVTTAFLSEKVRSAGNQLVIMESIPMDDATWWDEGRNSLESFFRGRETAEGDEPATALTDSEPMDDLLITPSGVIGTNTNGDGLTEEADALSVLFPDLVPLSHDSEEFSRQDRVMPANDGANISLIENGNATSLEKEDQRSKANDAVSSVPTLSMVTMLTSQEFAPVDYSPPSLSNKPASTPNPSAVISAPDLITQHNDSHSTPNQLVVNTNPPNVVMDGPRGNDNTENPPAIVLTFPGWEVTVTKIDKGRDIATLSISGEPAIALPTDQKSMERLQSAVQSLEECMDFFGVDLDGTTRPEVMEKWHGAEKEAVETLDAGINGTVDMVDSEVGDDADDEREVDVADTGNDMPYDYMAGFAGMSIDSRPKSTKIPSPESGAVVASKTSPMEKPLPASPPTSNPQTASNIPSVQISIETANATLATLKRWHWNGPSMREVLRLAPNPGYEKAPAEVLLRDANRSSEASQTSPKPSVALPKRITTLKQSLPVRTRSFSSQTTQTEIQTDESEDGMEIVLRTTRSKSTRLLAKVDIPVPATKENVNSGSKVKVPVKKTHHKPGKSSKRKADSAATEVVSAQTSNKRAKSSAAAPSTTVESDTTASPRKTFNTKSAPSAEASLADSSAKPSLRLTRSKAASLEASSSLNKAIAKRASDRLKARGL